jgi:signal transduction histidine kinase
VTQIKDSEKINPEEKLNLIINNVPIILFAIDKDGIFVFVEGKGAGEFKIPPARLKGISALKLFGSLEVNEETGNIISGRDVFRRVLKNKSVTATITIDGFCFDTRFSPMRNHHNEIIGVIGTAVNITDRRAVETEREKLLREIIFAERKLKVVSKKIIDIQENERKHISRELHDEIGQILTAIKIEVQTSLKYNESPEFKTHLEEVASLINHALDRVRSLSRDLRPSLLDDVGLVSALRWYIDKEGQRVGLKTKIYTDLDDKKLPPDLEITCYRIVQEALTNIIKHAEAKSVIIELYQDMDQLHLRIKDNGKGFDLFNTIKNAMKGKSLGIISMQERVELVGGKLNISSSSKKGTEIHAIFPMDE